MKIEIVTPPSEYPISLDLAKEHLNVTHDYQDSVISLRLGAAIENAENYLRRAVGISTYRATLNAFCNEIELPVSPLQSVVSIKYYDNSGALVTLDSAEYQIDEQGIVAVLSAVDSWPDTQDRKGAVIIEFTAGFSDTPKSIQAAILLTLGTLNEHHEDNIVGSSAGEIPLAAKSLLHPYRLYRS